MTAITGHRIRGLDPQQRLEERRRHLPAAPLPVTWWRATLQPGSMCKDATMLFVGLAGHGCRQPVINELAPLSAVTGSVDAPPSWDAAEPSIFILGGTRQAGETCWSGADHPADRAAAAGWSP